jgi:hypothetical protein
MPEAPFPQRVAGGDHMHRRALELAQGLAALASNPEKLSRSNRLVTCRHLHRNMR